MKEPGIRSAISKMKIALSLFCFVALIIIAPANAADSWNISTIDSAGDKGGETSIAVDSNAKAHIAYYDDDNKDLKYATNVSGSWALSIVDSAGDVGKESSMAVDTTGKVHIVYYDFTNLDLKYATNATGTWVASTVDSVGDIGNFTSIAVDAAGKVHVCYYDFTNGDLKYATNATSTWVISTIDSSGDVGRESSIAVDSSAKVHIAYYDFTNGDLKYATNVSGSWALSIVDSVGNVGNYTSIAIDSTGKVHISYQDVTNGDLKYATNAPGSWVASTVDSVGQVGDYSGIAVDSNGKIHIAYYNRTNGDLKYATNVSGSWALSTIDSTGDVGRELSIAVDLNDRVHISYHDFTNKDLKYATGGLQYTIYASASPYGTISPSGAVTVNYSADQSFTITPDANCHIVDVVVDTVSMGAITSYTFTNVTADHTISASFAIDTYTITASAGANGSISPSGAVTVNHGADQSFTITPNTGYHVADVLVDGVPQGAITSYTFTGVIANHTISASFAINTYTITASAGANGSISPSGVVTVNHGADQSFTITPNTGYHVGDVLVDGVSQGAITSYTFTGVVINHTISASFAVDPLTITTSSLPAGDLDTPYSQTLAASGGITPYSWLLSSGNLPNGLNLSSGGSIAGTPTASGTSNFIVQVTDAASSTATKNLSITVNADNARVVDAPPIGTATIQEAYDICPTGGTVQIQALDFIENLVCDHAVSVKLEGGYDTNYTSNSSYTVITGSMVVTEGDVVVENIVVQ